MGTDSAELSRNNESEISNHDLKDELGFYPEINQNKLNFADAVLEDYNS